jgi:hypothetical protein
MFNHLAWWHETQLDDEVDDRGRRYNTLTNDCRPAYLA